MTVQNQPAPVVVVKKRGGKSAAAVKAEVAEQGRKALKRLRERVRADDVKHGVAVLGAPVVVGLAHRFIADNAEQKILNGRKWEQLDRGEQIAAAGARQKAAVPHVAALGEAGTIGAVTVVGGLLTGNKTALAAGASLVGTELYIRTRGAVLVDKKAAERGAGGVALQTALAGDAATSDAGEPYDALAGDDDIIDADTISGSMHAVAGDHIDRAAQLAGELSAEDAAQVLEVAGDDDAALLQLLAQA